MSIRKPVPHKKRIKENNSSSDIDNLGLGDTVHIKSQNKTGMYYGEENSKIKVKTPNGMKFASKDDIEVIPDDDDFMGEGSLRSIVDNIETRLTESESAAEIDEGAVKNAALAAMLGLGMYAGFEATDADNTPLAKAMEAAAQQGDEYAAEELKNLTLYLDAGDTRMLTKLSNKYLGPIEDRTMNETKLTEGIIDRLRYIVDNKEMQRITFDNGDTLEVDMQTANAIVSLYNAVNDKNKAKIQDNIGKKEMFQKFADFAFQQSNSNKNESELVEKDEDDPCWDGYEQYGMKTTDGEEVPNCVSIDETTSYDNDLSPDDPVYVKGVKGVNSKPFNKKFKNMQAAQKWLDSEASDDYEIQQISNESRAPSRNALKESNLLAAMKNKSIAESFGLTSQEARTHLRNKYGYSDLDIARAQLDETTSAGSVASVSAPVGDTKKRSIYGEEEKNTDRDSAEANRDLAKKMGYDPDEDDYEDFLDMVTTQDMRETEDDSKDSEFISAWFYKSVDGEVEGPYNSESEAKSAANNYADWIKQGSDLDAGDRRLAKRAFLMKSSLSESKTVSSLEREFRSQLNEALNVNVSVDPKQPESRNISVTASEQEADELAGLLSNAGLFSSPGYGEVEFQDPTPEPINQPTSGYGTTAHMPSNMPMEEEKDHSNAPEEKFQDMSYMLDIISGGLNREKNSYDKAEDGDNPMGVVKEEDDTAVGTMDEFYSYVLDFYGPNGIYDIGATEEEVKKATEIVKNDVGDDFEGDSVDREKVRDVILDQMRSEEEREEAKKAFRSKEEVDPDLGKNAPDPIQTRGDVDDDMDRMRNFNETDEVKRLAGLI